MIGNGETSNRKSIAVVGTGISGMAAAWLLSERHDVTVYEQDRRVGGHSNTVTVRTSNGDIPVDTGFIVYNEKTYPNLTALFAHLGVKTQASEMSFAASLNGGEFEYSGGSIGGLIAQKRNLLRPRFWAMLNDLRRFYREAPRDLDTLNDRMTLRTYLDINRYGDAFRDNHLLPMAAAIWSSPSASILDYPAAAFIRFHDNHGLLQIRDRPQWRTVSGGSRSYVQALTRRYANRIRIGSAAQSVANNGNGVLIRSSDGRSEQFDDVVIATHADQALALLEKPTASERRLLGAIRYSTNRMVLHSDATFMPKRRATWSSWNFLGDGATIARPSVTYWMNGLQNIRHDIPLFVTLNPAREPRSIYHVESYDHPLFDTAAISAQRELWSLQGRRNIWFCGAYFGAGFHEDGLQAGLAVAETLGGVRRPWNVENESGRIFVGNNPRSIGQSELAE